MNFCKKPFDNETLLTLILWYSLMISMAHHHKNEKNRQKKVNYIMIIIIGMSNWFMFQFSTKRDTLWIVLDTFLWKMKLWRVFCIDFFHFCVFFFCIKFLYTQAFIIVFDRKTIANYNCSFFIECLFSQKNKTHFHHFKWWIYCTIGYIGELVSFQWTKKWKRNGKES